MSVGTGTVGGTFRVGPEAAGIDETGRLVSAAATVTVTDSFNPATETVTVTVTVTVAATDTLGEEVITGTTVINVVTEPTTAATVPAAAYVTTGNVETGYRWESGTLSVTQQVGGRWQARFTIIDVDNDFTFERGDPVRIVADSLGEVFTGYVDTSRKVKVHRDATARHVITCMDQRFLAEKRTVAAEWTTRLAGNIVRDVHRGQLGDIPGAPTGILNKEGVTTPGTIENGPQLPSVVANYAYIDELFDALATRAGFVWFIDKNKALHFHGPAAACCPPLSTPIDTAQIVRGSFESQVGLRRYRNREAVIGGTAITTVQTETLDPDGAKQSFVVGYPLAKVPTVKVDAVAETVGILGVDTGKDWYWQQGSPVITQDIGGTPVPGTSALTVEYQGEYPTAVIVEDGGEIATEQTRTGSTGIVDHVTRVADSYGTDESLDLATQLLDHFATHPTRVTFEVADATRTDITPGRTITVEHPDLEGGTVDVVVESVAVSHVGGTLYRKKVTATNGPADSDAAFVFRPAGPAGPIRLNIAENAVLNVVTTTPETVAVTESVTVTSYTCSQYGSANYNTAAAYC